MLRRLRLRRTRSRSRSRGQLDSVLYVDSPPQPLHSSFLEDQFLTLFISLWDGCDPQPYVEKSKPTPPKARTGTKPPSETNGKAKPAPAEKKEKAVVAEKPKEEVKKVEKVVDPAEEEKKRKRAERFGLPTGVSFAFPFALSQFLFHAAISSSLADPCSSVLLCKQSEEKKQKV